MKRKEKRYGLFAMTVTLILIGFAFFSYLAAYRTWATIHGGQSNSVIKTGENEYRVEFFGKAYEVKTVSPENALNRKELGVFVPPTVKVIISVYDFAENVIKEIFQ